MAVTKRKNIELWNEVCGETAVPVPLCPPDNDWPGIEHGPPRC